ncbi:MAG: putative toxin-antitoxin system toxin component, PIN family [Clostridia bacterium]|nr:putative toxin-antitoxin system toxin component, PIN family [Clostridia bacterium]
MVYYAVIDTNVLISAMLKWNSVPGNVLEFTFSGTIVPVLNEHIVHEYREVLSRPKFKFPKDIIDTVVSEIERLGIYIDAPELEVELPDPKDRVFYEVVMEERNTEDAYLVTGNLKHFPEKPFVVTPRQMIDIIVGNMEE